MLWQSPYWVGFVAAAWAIVQGTLLEYWVHRWMHRQGLAQRRHGGHHQRGQGQGVFGEFRDYMLVGGPFCVLAFCFSLVIGVGFTIGAVGYLAFSAYAHQCQHERPELVFWLKAPVHHLHHRHHMTRYNYGIAVDFWDRTFGTYQARSWDQRAAPRVLSEYFRIRWF